MEHSASVIVFCLFFLQLASCKIISLVNYQQIIYCCPYSVFHAKTKQSVMPVNLIALAIMSAKTSFAYLFLSLLRTGTQAIHRAWLIWSRNWSASTKSTNKSKLNKCQGFTLNILHLQPIIIIRNLKFMLSKGNRWGEYHFDHTLALSPLSCCLVNAYKRCYRPRRVG